MPKARLRRLAQAAALSAVAAIPLASCGGTKTNTVTVRSVPTSTAAASSSTQTTAPTQTATSGQSAPAQVLGTTHSSLGLTFEVTALKRTSPQIVELDFTITNTGGQSGVAPSLGGGEMSQVSLVDEPGQKRYLTIQDSNGNCVCTNNLDDGSPGYAPHTSGTFFAQFPAPPASVPSIDVDFATAPPIHNVPISG